MKKKLLIMLCIIILVSAFGATSAFAVEEYTDPPSGYVVTDGTTYFWIDFNELFISYLSYRIDPNSDDGKLAKFYFDTLGDDPLTNMAAYVSGITTKFVRYSEIFLMYAITRDVDATYIWFNSADPADATPAFGVITQVTVLGSDGSVSGFVHVGVDGYIITLPGEKIIIPGFKSISIEANQTNVTVNLWNPAENPCYFVISIELDDGTLLYESGMLAPGESLNDITLLQAMAPGEYPATVKYDTYSLSDMSPMNSAEVVITLIAD